MESRIEEADARHRAKYNCAQAVACTYCDLVGIDEETAFRATEGFGLGMGCMDGTCGALSGACFLVGLATSDGKLDAPASKRDCYALSKRLLDGFREKNGSTTCRELKGVGCDHGPLRSCSGCIEDACRLVESALFSE